MMKPRVPSWQTIRWMNWFVLVVCGTAALLSTIDDTGGQWGRWLILVNAFVAGSSAASVFHITNIIHMRFHFDALAEAFKHMSGLMEAVVQNKIEMFVRSTNDDEDEKPIAPRLH